MTTASDVATAGLKRILVEAADAPLQPDEYADFYSGMNIYMAALEAEGIRLGYTAVTAAADEITVPAGAIRGIIANVAIEVSADYGGTVSPALIKQASGGLRAMRRLGQNTAKTRYPATLPIGSGSQNEVNHFPQFYDGAASALLSLAGNTRATSIATAGDTAIINGFWSIETTKGMRGDIKGRITNTDDQTHLLTANVAVTIAAATAGIYSLDLYQNGVSISTVPFVTGAALDVTLKEAVTIKPGDYLELWLINGFGSVAITVSSAQFEVG